jgi:hypothetical protein
MVLVLASAVFLGSESLGTHDHILHSQIWDLPFRRPIRLAGSRWRYSTPPPHGFTQASKSHCGWRSVSQSVSQSLSFGVEPHLGLITKYLLLFDSYSLVIVGSPLSLLSPRHGPWRKQSFSIVEEAFLLIRFLAVDVLLLPPYSSAGMYLPSRCLEMGPYVTLFIMTFLYFRKQNSKIAAT